MKYILTLLLILTISCSQPKYCKRAYKAESIDTLYYGVVHIFVSLSGYYQRDVILDSALCNEGDTLIFTDVKRRTYISRYY
jgi:hypothetical protein